MLSTSENIEYLNYRKDLYLWFFSLFVQELNSDQYFLYRDQQAKNLIDLCNKFNISPNKNAAKRFEFATLKLNGEKNSYIDLAADFTQMFLLSGKNCAIPYASFYQEEKMYGDIQAKMQQFLQHNKLEVSTKFKEPEDHIAIFLNFIAIWIAQDTKYQDLIPQAEFIQQALLNWIELFYKKSQQIQTIYDFYPAFIELFVDFIKYDYNFLITYNQ